MTGNGYFRKIMLLVGFAGSAFIYVCYNLLPEEGVKYGRKEVSEYYFSKDRKYLINTSKCRIPNTDPFNEEVRKYVHREKYTNCSNLGLLSYIDKTSGVAVLKINTSVIPQYSFFKIECCYAEIHRTNSYHNKSDDEVRYSSCITFEEETVLSYPFVKVDCWNFFHKIYSNVHATVIPTTNQKVKTDGSHRYSVLVVGIDSISKFNLRRTMPKTYTYLEEHFHNLKGYNKIGDNTFPNLMAVLTGQNFKQLEESCNKSVRLNHCDFVWNSFRKLGYVTAYAEDECSIGTFNFNRPGFKDPPTDYYYRPYFVAAEELFTVARGTMTYCAGPETSGDRVFNAVRDFSVSFKDVPSFGLFWSNSFSHNDINMPSAMDERVLRLLTDSDFKSSLKDTVMLFLSDHGMRFGDIRYTHTGWLEERLPFIYVYIPDSFKKNFRKKYESLLVNTERLITPYDLYCTFQEILEMSNSGYKALQSTGCPNCHSLFSEADEERTCRGVAIDQHWCTCTGYHYVNANNNLVKQIAQYVLGEVNSIVKGSVEGQLCSSYGLKDIISAGISENYLNEKNQTIQYFLVIIKTCPVAMFEATVEVYWMSVEQSSFRLRGDISRVDWYKDNSECVNSSSLKSYCYCDGYITFMRSFMNCYFFYN